MEKNAIIPQIIGGIARIALARKAMTAGKFLGNLYRGGLAADAASTKAVFNRGLKGFIDIEKAQWNNAGKFSKTLQGTGWAAASHDVGKGIIQGDGKQIAKGIGYAVAPTSMMTVDAVKGTNSYFKNKNLKNTTEQVGQYF